MSTNPITIGRTTAFQAPAGAAASLATADMLAVLTRNLSAVMMDGLSSTSSVLTVQRADAPRARGLSAALAQPASAITTGADAASAAAVLTSLQTTSDLTLDELADVLGTSRRTLHNWKNGEALSAKNERRLRDLGHAVAEIARHVRGSARDTLRAKCDDGVRPLDLLAEGRFAAAIQLATGRRSAGRTEPGDAVKAALAARLDPVGPIEPVGRAKVLKRPSRRKRG